MAFKDEVLCPAGESLPDIDLSPEPETGEKDGQTIFMHPQTSSSYREQMELVRESAKWAISQDLLS